MFRVLIIIFLSLLIFTDAISQPDTAQKIISGRKNSPQQQNKPYVILISIDGFRYDYIEKHNATFLREKIKKGVKAEYMIPSFPTLTFPNHYSIVTGLYPSHHGLTGNTVYDQGKKDLYSMRNVSKVTDGSWYGGKPLWVLAEEQQMLSASFYWVGSEANIHSTFPTYYYRYNEIINIDKRIETVVDWLQLPEEKRPHFITFYFPEVDHKGHSYGPDAPETGAAVRWVDSSIHKLTEAVKNTGLEVNFIIVSDHGMTKIDQEETIKAPVMDTTRFVSVFHGELIHYFAKNKADVKPFYDKLKKSAQNYSVYLKKDVPRRLHYNDKHDYYNRIGDILLIPDWPKVFVISARKPNPGVHGFDPFLVPDMRTIFYAWGPCINEGHSIAPIKNVDVYPVITEILKLPYAEKIDGNRKIIRKVLKKM